MVNFLAGNMVYLAYVQHLDPAPYPSLADWDYLGLYPPILIGLVLFLRGSAALLRRSVILDGIVAWLGAATVAGALVAVPLVSGSHGRRVSKTPKRPGSSARWAATSCRATTTVAPSRPRAVWRV